MKVACTVLEGESGGNPADLLRKQETIISKRYVYKFFDYSMEIQIFSNSKFGQLRVALNEKWETVFCLADVCKALDLANPSQVKMRLE